MSLHESRLPTLRDELEAQAKDAKAEITAAAAKLEAVTKAKTRVKKEVKKKGETSE